MKKLAMAIIFVLGLSVAPFCYGKDKILERAKPYLPLIKKAQVDYWPTMKRPSLFAGQIEQETGGKWSPRAELKTSREYGFGLTQITIAYDKFGKERFNNFKAVKAMHKDMASWTWENRYDPSFQIKGMVLMDMNYYRMLHLPVEMPESEKYLFVIAAYNGGVGGTLADRKLCAKKKGCNPNKWYGNVELTSNKSKVKYKGYGKSFFEINREYVSNIDKRWAVRYAQFLD